MEARFSALVQTGPGAYPGSCTIGTGSSREVKRPVGPSWPLLGRTLSLPAFCTYVRTNSDCLPIQYEVTGFCDPNKVFTARYELNV